MQSEVLPLSLVLAFAFLLLISSSLSSTLNMSVSIRQDDMIPVILVNGLLGDLFFELLLLFVALSLDLIGEFVDFCHGLWEAFCCYFTALFLAALQ
jgi:hypothetical protein